LINLYVTNVANQNMNNDIIPLIAEILLLREATEDYIIFDNGFHINT